MFKEIKYLIFVIVVFSFIFFTSKYYFSDENIKISHRANNNISEKIKIYSKKLPILKDDTNNVIFYVNQSNKKKKKKFNFWKLLDNDE
tara:strand:- start:1237 stop:1500 length:264 start_codon:yes stop_codon:yes gene_type:complete